MIKKILYLLPLLFLFCVPNASAVGGTCPSGALYIVPGSNALLSLSGMGITGCIFVADNGSDSSNGTTKLTPFLHSPGMPQCAVTCLSTHPNAGTAMIFKGGDIWHFVNASLAPYTGGALDMNIGNAGWTGSTSHPIYIGVDFTWFSGAFWTRPIFDADNEITSSTTLNACTNSGVAQTTGIPAYTNTMVGLQDHNILDNIEMTGMCQSVWDSNKLGDNNFDHYVVTSSNAGMTRDYIHGWSHVKFDVTGCPAEVAPTSPPPASGFICPNFNFIQGGTTFIASQIVIDGWDSDNGGGNSFYGGIYQINDSVLRHAADLRGSDAHLFYNNLVEFWVGLGNYPVHTNTWESTGDHGGGANAFYNNVIRHTYIGESSFGAVNIWPRNLTSIFYMFGNVVYDQNSGGNYLNLQQNDADQLQTHLFNNLFEQPVNTQPILQCSQTTRHPTLAVSNLYITDYTSAYSSPCHDVTFAAPTTERTINHSAATTAGFTDSETPWPYAPPTGGTVTVGAGTNSAARCAELATFAATDTTLSDAANACLFDTTFAVAYDSTNHAVIPGPARTPVIRPTSAAWDQGPFQFTAGLPTVADPTCAPIAGLPPQTVTCSDLTSGAVICYRVDGVAPTAPTAGTCGASTTQYSGAISITVNPTTLKLIATLSGDTNSGVISYNFTGGTGKSGVGSGSSFGTGTEVTKLYDLLKGLPSFVGR